MGLGLRVIRGCVLCVCVCARAGSGASVPYLGGGMAVYVGYPWLDTGV